MWNNLPHFKLVLLLQLCLIPQHLSSSQSSRQLCSSPECLHSETHSERENEILKTKPSVCLCPKPPPHGRAHSSSSSRHAEVSPPPSQKNKSEGGRVPAVTQILQVAYDIYFLQTPSDLNQGKLMARGRSICRSFLFLWLGGSATGCHCQSGYRSPNSICLALENL